MKLTKDEKANGWDEQSLAAYRSERDKLADVVAGNVVTDFKRGKPAVVVEGPSAYSPFTRQVR